MGPASALLSDGRVIVIGGYEGDNSLGGSVSLFDPQAMSWTAGSPIPVPRTFLLATTLSNGVVLVNGGWGPSSADAKRTWLYLPGSDTWMEASTSGFRRLWLTSVPLRDGWVLAPAGGPSTRAERNSDETGRGEPVAESRQ